MSIVTRAPKAGSGTENYAPNTTILSAEVNLDFNSLYDDYDGNVDSTNIRADSITGDRLADSPNGITVNKLNDLIVTTVKIADGAVSTSKLADGAVTTAKLAVGATVALAIGPVNVPVNTLVTTSEVTLVDTGTFTSRNSPVLLTGYGSFICVLGGSAITSVNTLTVRLYGYNSTFGPGLLQTLHVVATLAQTTTTLVQYPAVVPFSLVNNPGGLPLSGYRITVQASQADTGNPSSSWFTVPTSAGFLQGTELS
jgi:hypothetical protein